MAVVHLSPTEMDNWASLPEDHPVTVNDRQVKAYAKASGGVTLQYWQLALGRVWGRPYMMTNDEVAARLGRPEADMDQIAAATGRALGWTRPVRRL